MHSYTYAYLDKPRESQVVSAVKAVILGEEEGKKRQNLFSKFLGQLVDWRNLSSLFDGFFLNVFNVFIRQSRPELLKAGVE